MTPKLAERSRIFFSRTSALSAGSERNDFSWANCITIPPRENKDCLDVEWIFHSAVESEEWTLKKPEFYPLISFTFQAIRKLSEALTELGFVKIEGAK